MSKRFKVICDHAGHKKCFLKCKHAKAHYAETYHEGCDEAGECWDDEEPEPIYAWVQCKPVKEVT